MLTFYNTVGGGSQFWQVSVGQQFQDVNIRRKNWGCYFAHTGESFTKSHICTLLTFSFRPEEGLFIPLIHHSGVGGLFQIPVSLWHWSLTWSCQCQQCVFTQDSVHSLNVHYELPRLIIPFCKHHYFRSQFSISKHITTFNAMREPLVLQVTHVKIHFENDNKSSLI